MFKLLDEVRDSPPRLGGFMRTIARTILALAALGGFFPAGRAWADDNPPPDKSHFTLFNPTPDADLRSLCTDRPTKSTGTCTVDAGHWQLESDIYNVTWQSAGGVTTRTELFTNPNLKLGLTNTLDVEVNWNPWQQVTTRDRATNATTAAASGIGDVFFRAKWNLLGGDGGDVALALVPWVKAPTAPSNVGNGKVEAGLVPAIQLNLPKNWQLVIDPEVDMLANASGHGYHVNTSGLLSFSYPLIKELTGSFEIWGDKLRSSGNRDADLVRPRARLDSDQAPDFAVGWRGQSRPQQGDSEGAGLYRHLQALLSQRTARPE